MHGVVEFRTFTASAKKAGVTADELDGIVEMLARNPQAGEVIQGTGGARKARYAKKSTGKSGGYRVITFYAADDIPVMMLDIYGKGQKVNLTKAEKNSLAKVLGQIENAYRAGTRATSAAEKANQRTQE